MTHDEERIFLIKYLLKERSDLCGISIPEDACLQWKLLRSLMNIRPASPIGDDFLAVQDDFLKEETKRKGIVDISSLEPVKENIYLWQGDITRVRCDAIVNAANSGLTGCYIPCHSCIDNVIHTYAGIQLRLECAGIMEKQGHEEETGGAKITSAYNLPSSYVIHTVGPIVAGRLEKRHETLLSSCYRSSLSLASSKALDSLAFCCISTGEFHFPAQRAAEIAVETVQRYLKENDCGLKVVFNVFKERDREIYERVLGKYREA